MSKLKLPLAVLVIFIALLLAPGKSNVVPVAECATIPCSQAVEACDAYSWGIIVSCYENGGTYTQCKAQYEAAHNWCMESHGCTPLFD